MSREETPRHGHAPIPMRAVEDTYNAIQKLGDFAISADGTRIRMALPGGKPTGWVYVNLPIRSLDARDAGLGDGWGWDGNREKPTLTPSVHTFGHWHGWVRNGEMVEA